MATIGYGTRYEVWDGAFVPIARVFDIVPGARRADRIETTNLLTRTRGRHYVAGRVDPGEITIQLNDRPGLDQDRLIRRLMSAGTVASHRITFPEIEAGIERPRITVSGVITGLERAVPLGDRMVATVTVAVSGDEDWDTLIEGIDSLRVYEPGVYVPGVYVGV